MVQHLDVIFKDALYISFYCCVTNYRLSYLREYLFIISVLEVRSPGELCRVLCLGI